MRITHNAASDVVCIRFSDEIVLEASHGNPLGGSYVETGVGESGKIVRIQIRSASKVLPPGVVEEIMKASGPT